MCNVMDYQQKSINPTATTPTQTAQALNPKPAQAKTCAGQPIRPLLRSRGAAAGYHRAGYNVTGVDNKPQKRYPFTFIQADAIEYVKEHGREYDIIHASPPCQVTQRNQTLSPRSPP